MNYAVLDATDSVRWGNVTIFNYVAYRVMVILKLRTIIHFLFN